MQPQERAQALVTILANLNFPIILKEKIIQGIISAFADDSSEIETQSLQSLDLKTPIFLAEIIFHCVESQGFDNYVKRAFLKWQNDPLNAAAKEEAFKKLSYDLKKPLLEEFRDKLSGKMDENINKPTIESFKILIGLPPELPDNHETIPTSFVSFSNEGRSRSQTFLKKAGTNSKLLSSRLSLSLSRKPSAQSETQESSRAPFPAFFKSGVLDRGTMTTQYLFKDIRWLHSNEPIADLLTIYKNIQDNPIAANTVRYFILSLLCLKDSQYKIQDGDEPKEDEHVRIYLNKKDLLIDFKLDGTIVLEKIPYHTAVRSSKSTNLLVELLQNIALTTYSFLIGVDPKRHDFAAKMSNKNAVYHLQFISYVEKLVEILYPALIQEFGEDSAPVLRD